MTFRKGQSIRPKPGHDIYQHAEPSRYVVIGQSRDWIGGESYTTFRQVEPALGEYFTLLTELVGEWFEEVEG